MLELSKKLDLNTKLQNRNFRLDQDKFTYRRKLCEKILPNIKIVFLPKITTVWLQPLHAGLI